MNALSLSGAALLLCVSQTALAAGPTSFPIWPVGEAPGARTSPVRYELSERSKDPALPDRAGKIERCSTAGDPRRLL